jgi:hypothetical protein
MNKPLTFLLSLTFLFLFSGSVYGEEEVKREYWNNGNKKVETHYKNGKKRNFKLLVMSQEKKEHEVYFQEGDETNFKKYI